MPFFIYFLVIISLFSSPNLSSPVPFSPPNDNNNLFIQLFKLIINNNLLPILIFDITVPAIKNSLKESNLKSPETSGYLEVDVWFPDLKLGFEFQVPFLPFCFVCFLFSTSSLSFPHFHPKNNLEKARYQFCALVSNFLFILHLGSASLPPR